MSHRSALAHMCAVAVIASSAIAALDARPRTALSYRVRILPTEAVFVTDFNDREQLTGVNITPTGDIGFVWDARRGVDLIQPLGRYDDAIAWAGMSRPLLKFGGGSLTTTRPDDPPLP